MIKKNSSTSKFLIILLSGLFWGIIFIISLWWNLKTIENHAFDNALNQGRFVFNMIETTRLWNARHGGVYVKRNEWSPSNKYLETDEKNIQTPKGVKLTKMNPAYMTRQLAELILQNNNTKVHLTSLNPINPGNFADDWEAQALRSFEKDVKERMEIVSSMVRYMAPLFVKKACLTCHEKQGYKEGDVRGGISVTFSAQPFMQAIEVQKNNMIIIHIVIWLLLTAFTAYLFKRIQEHEKILIAEKEKQEHLVESRTKALKNEVQMRRGAEEKMRLLVDTSAQAILGLDAKGRITFANPAAHNILGYVQATDIIGKNVCKLLQPQDVDGNYISVQDCRFISTFSQGRSVHSEDEQFKRSDGTYIAVEYNTHPLVSDGQLVGAVINFSDISHRRILEQALWRQANYDELTDIPNRSLFMDRLQTAIKQSKRMQGQLALLYMDLDGFKLINDTYGHYAGDEVLRIIAGRIQVCIRETDTLARLGGDEFTVLLANINNREEAAKIADEIAHITDEPIYYENEKLYLSLSIGVALFPEHANSLDNLVKAADQAMYQAKDNSGTSYLFVEK
jgi:diguanylate cyclase (GGDEF)-like protein/PAS domain S-box-containing protein